MAKSEKKKSSRTIVTPVGVVLWENLVKPDDGMRFANGDVSKAKPTWGLTFGLPKRNDDGSENTEVTEFVKQFNQNITDICADVDFKFYDPDGSPLKDGDETDEDGKLKAESRAGFWFLNLKKETKHGTIGVVATDEEGKTIALKPEEMPKRGDLVKVSILQNWWEVGAGKGVSAKPKGVKYIGKGSLGEQEALSAFADDETASDIWSSETGGEGSDAGGDDDF